MRLNEALHRGQQRAALAGGTWTGQLSVVSICERPDPRNQMRSGGRSVSGIEMAGRYTAELHPEALGKHAH